MALPSPNYPASTWAGNEQDTGTDIPGDDKISNAADYNLTSAEVNAIEADLRAAMADASDANIAAAIARLNLAAATAPDGVTSHLWIPAQAFVRYSGTWAFSLYVAQYYRYVRTASASESKIVSPLGVRGRSTSRGLRIDSYDFVYRVATAAVNTDVKFLLRRWDVPADGAVPSGGVLLGTYDTNHDSAAKRGAIAEHTARVTVGEFVGDYAWHFEVVVNDTGGGTSSFGLYGIRVNLTDVPN